MIKKNLREILSFLFFPVYLIIFFPILLIAKFLNFVIHFSDSISNIKFFAYYDHFITKLILVDKNFIKKPIKIYDNTTLINPLILEEGFDFPLSMINKKDLESKNFEVCIKSKNKRDALKYLNDLFGKADLQDGDINKILLATDKKFGTDLYETIITNGYIPNFIRSDIRVWEGIVEQIKELRTAQYDYPMRTKKLDIPGTGNIMNHFWTVEDQYPVEISRYSDFISKIKLHLWRINKVDIEEGVGDTAEILGEWIYQLCIDSRKFLYLSVRQSKSLDNLSTATEIDFYLRNVFYGILQSADTEINNRISIPFKNSLSIIDADSMVGDYNEFKQFLIGKYPPSMGGIGKFLNYIVKTKNLDKVGLEFKKFVNESEYLNIENITEKKFIQKLYQLGRLRGSIMHPDKINIHDCISIISYLFEYKYPGDFFYKIGINNGY